MNKGIQMDLKNHFFLTFVALFFLGIIVAKPGNAFLIVKEDRECRLVKGKMDCAAKSNEYEMNNALSPIKYRSQE